MQRILCFLGVLLSVFVAAPAHAQTVEPFCDARPQLCTETKDVTDYEGNYIGHDEPSVLFYSNKRGSGNSNVYFMRLPKDPPTLPKQDGSGGTFNFQLHSAFWFGMAMCDSQSHPNFTKVCSPDSDDNIFDDANPASAHYIGHHPGTAFMEMQFYPPGWVLWPPGNSCDAFKYCAALNIDSLSESLTSFNNNACRNNAGDEPVNFAFVTKNGVPLDAADPQVNTDKKFTVDPNNVLLMNPGDTLEVILRDTNAGFQVLIIDLTTHQSGSMTASTANGFAQIKFDPAAATCTSLPYAFHPMYATSSEHTRVSWAAHSYNIAFSDEIGHFEYCSGITDANFHVRCPATGGDPPGSRDLDDNYCFGPLASSRVQIGGCFDIFSGGDVDFDGPDYFNNWAGTIADDEADRAVHAQPIRFTSPLFIHTEDEEKSDDEADSEHEVELRNYDRAAFEADLPRIESSCNRTTGVGCVNPPPGAGFYPFFTTGESESPDQCVWQLGGARIPETEHHFGGSSTTAFGPLLQLAYASAAPPGFILRYNNFRRILDDNPCRVDLGENSESDSGSHSN